MNATLELSPSRTGAARLGRLPGITRGRTRRVTLAWHDAADGALRRAGLAASEHEGAWRLERLAPGADGAWLPGAPPPIIAEAATLAALGVTGNGTAEVARFTGRAHAVAVEGVDGVECVLLRGAVEGGGQRRAECRLRLTGPARGVEAACAGLGEALDLAVPRGGLSAGVLGVAPGLPRADPIAAGASVGEFVAAALPALAWPVLLGATALVAEPSAERVHETRVAVRRLRSVLGVVRRPVACGAAETLRPMLHELADRLGAARDWDVFLEGVGARLEERFGTERDAARLLAAARRQRTASYAALRTALAGPGQRALERQLACLAALHPWEQAGPGQVAVLGEDAAAFAAAVLDKRLRRVRRAGRGFKQLTPEALHALRKDGKRLRYAAEAFAPLFPGAPARRFLKRLRALQGALGDMQDAQVARDLLARLGSAGRGYAGGVAVGLAEGRTEALQAEARAAWRRFAKTDAFWR